jgi:autophagy-related protein 9
MVCHASRLARKNSLFLCRQFRDIQDFCRNRIGISDVHLGNMPWPELLLRVVALQRSVKLSLRGELSEHDIVMRVMRKDDYLIGAHTTSGHC